jgi:transcriptional regulator with XRE-family HTH domain
MKKIGWKIKNLRTQLGMTQAELGKKVGDYPQATVAKWENDKQFPRTEAIMGLAEIAGVSHMQFVGLEPIPTSELPGRSVEVVTRVQAGAWQAAVELDRSERFNVPVVLPKKWDNVPIHAARVDGDSMNHYYPDGSIVFATALENMPGGLKSGQHVIVVKEEHGEYEVTLKEYVVDEQGNKWLWPRSSSPEHQTPIQYSPRSQIEIRAVVVGATINAPGV